MRGRALGSPLGSDTYGVFRMALLLAIRLQYLMAGCLLE